MLSLLEAFIHFLIGFCFRDLDQHFVPSGLNVFRVDACEQIREGLLPSLYLFVGRSVSYMIASPEETGTNSD